MGNETLSARVRADLGRDAMSGHSEEVDCVVIGAGVVGLATARALALRGLEVVVVEAADAIGTGTSSRNSEVIHAGIYYPTGSLKARLCVAGRERLYRYCADRDIRHRRTGKLIVATTEAEIPILEKYLAQARANGVDDLEWLSGGAAMAAEPAIRCVRALRSPSTGIIDSHELMLALQGDLEAHGGTVALNGIVEQVVSDGGGFDIVIAGAGAPAIRARRLVNAAGLTACHLARRIEGLAPASIPLPRYARGHYYTLSGRSPFNGLVYPVAESAGLGVHVTLDLAGRARFGPDVQWIDDIDYAFDDSNRERFVTAIRRYYPGLDEARLQPSYAGIRPKITGPGEAAADFILQGGAEHGVRGLVNLYGIESPGLTACLAIGDAVADLLP